MLISVLSFRNFPMQDQCCNKLALSKSGYGGLSRLFDVCTCKSSLKSGKMELVKKKEKWKKIETRAPGALNSSCNSFQTRQSLAPDILFKRNNNEMQTDSFSSSRLVFSSVIYVTLVTDMITQTGTVSEYQRCWERRAARSGLHQGGL